MKTFLLLYVLSGLWGSKPEPTGQSLLLITGNQVCYYDVDTDPSTIHTIWRTEGSFGNCLVHTNPDRLVCYVNNGIYEFSRDGQVKPLVLETDSPPCSSYFDLSPDGKNLLYTYYSENFMEEWTRNLREGALGTTRHYGSRYKIAVRGPSGSVFVLENTIVDERSQPHWLNNDEILYHALDSTIKIANVTTGHTRIFFDGRDPLPLGYSGYFLFDNAVLYTSFTPPNPPSGDPKELQEIGWGVSHSWDSKGLYAGSVQNRNFKQKISVNPRSMSLFSLRWMMKNDPTRICSCRKSGRLVFWVPYISDFTSTRYTTLYISAPIHEVGKIRFVVKKKFPFYISRISEVPTGSEAWLRPLKLDVPAGAIKEKESWGTLMGSGPWPEDYPTYWDYYPMEKKGKAGKH